MKHPIQQIKGNLLGVTAIDGVAMVSSRDVATMFEKRHDHVLRDIGNILSTAPKSGVSEEAFIRHNFKPTYYKDASGKKNTEYLMTRNGFTLLAVGFTGSRALKFKIAYINRFNEMEQFIYSRNLARLEYPELTDMIKQMHEKPMFFHFSNEADMINKIVLGMTAKQYRKEHGIDKAVALRDHITPGQADLIQKLQKVDVGLVVAIPDFTERKKALQAYFDKLQFVGRLSA